MRAEKKKAKGQSARRADRKERPVPSRAGPSLFKHVFKQSNGDLEKGDMGTKKKKSCFPSIKACVHKLVNEHKYCVVAEKVKRRRTEKKKTQRDGGAGREFSERRQKAKCNKDPEAEGHVQANRVKSIFFLSKAL